MADNSGDGNVTEHVHIAGAPGGGLPAATQSNVGIIDHKIAQTIGSKDPFKSSETTSMAVTSFIFPVLSSSVLMAFCYGMGRFDYSFLWIGIFVGLNFAKSKLWKDRQKQLLARQAIARVEKEIVLAELGKLSDLPAWVQFPDTERAEWINKMILQLWPYIGDYTKKFMKENIEPVVKQNLPSMFRSFQFGKMDMGDIPLRVTGIKVYTANVGRDRIVMDMDVAYAGDCEFDVNVGAFSAGLNNLQVKGKLRCHMKPLVPVPPMIGGVSAYFLDPPTIDFNLTGIGEMVELPGLLTAVRNVVASQVANICVLPNEIVVPLMPDIDPVKLYFPEPDGVVRIHLIGARNIENRDIGILKGKSDPYARVSVGAQSFKSPVVDNNLNPEWNQFYEAVVDQANGQRVIIEIFDEDVGSKDEFLGRCVVDLDIVKKRGVVDQWYPLEGAKHGDLHVKLFWLSMSTVAQDLEKSRHDAQQWEVKWLNADTTLNCAMFMIYIDSAKGIPSPKSDLEPTPYIEVTAANQTKRSYSKPKTANPIYQEKFMFLLDNPDNQQVKLEAKEEGSNRTLGECMFPIRRLLQETNMEIRDAPFNLVLGSSQAQLMVTARLRVLTGTEERKGKKTKQEGSVVRNNPKHAVNTNTNHAIKSNGQPSTAATASSSINEGSDVISNTLPRRRGSQKKDNVSHSGSMLDGLTGQRFSKQKISTLDLTPGQLGNLRISIEFSRQRSKLIVSVIEAESLHSFNDKDTAQPYVKVTLYHDDSKKEKRKTGNAKFFTLHPQWHSEFEYDLSESTLSEYALRFKVYDGLNYGMFSKAPVMGQIYYKLGGFDPESILNEWFIIGPNGYKNADIAMR